jgi:acyl carrier protein
MLASLMFANRLCVEAHGADQRPGVEVGSLRKSKEYCVMQEIVRRLLEQHGRLHIPVASLLSDADLYDAGLTPFAAIRVMLSLEEEFEIEFPVRMLCRQSFASIDAIAGCLNELEAASKFVSSRAA